MSFKGQLLKAGTVYGIEFALSTPMTITKSNTATSGTIRDLNIVHTEGANSMSKITEVLRVSLESEYYTGDWINAIVGRIDFGTNGDARGGMAAAICAEMNMPAKSYASIGGPSYSLDCEFNCPTGFVAGDRVTYPIAFINFGLWGGAKAQFDAEGYIFHTDGLTAGSGKVLSANSTTLRINVEGADKYIPISGSEDSLVMSVSETGTSGTVRDVNVSHTNGANSMSKIIEALRVSIASEFYTGDWINAIVGRIDFGTAGDARGGMAAAICAEMNMPAKSYASIGGPSYSLDLEFNCPTNFVAGDRITYPIAFMNMGLWGGAKSEFDAEGYIFHTDGLTAGAGKLLSADSNTLRVNIEGADRYLVMTEAENGLHLGTSGAKNTLAASAPHVSVYTTSSAATGNLRQAQFDVTYTGTTTATSIEALTAILTSNVKTGAWASAIFGKVDYSTNGLAHGIAGVICAELDLPGSTIVRGEYCCFEAELNIPANCDGLTNPVSFITMNCWGTNVANFQQSGYLFNIGGLGTAGATKLFQTNSDQPTHALRILIDHVPYFLLMTNVTDGTE